VRTRDDVSYTPIATAAPEARTARSLDGRTILLATNGTAEARAAARVALALAGQRGARPEVLRTFDANTLAIPGASTAILSLADDLLGDAAHAAQERELRFGLAAQLGEIPSWPVHVRVGTPAGSIVREAEKVNASMILVGLRRHGFVDRALRDETTLRVVRAARVPVLAVTPAMSGLPRTIVVGVDFSRASLRAARAALSVLGDSGTLLLAYARADVHYDEANEGAGVIETQGVAASFERMRADLAAPAGVDVAPVVLIGDPARELRALAERTGAQLIAVGSHRHELIERWLIGSVTSDLVRDGRVSLLVVPPATTISSSGDAPM